MATSVFVAMAQSKLLKFLLFLTTLILSVNGQSVNVTIMTDPNMASYTVGDNLTLTCMVDPLPTSTATNVSYSWNCSGCFADGMNSSVFNQVLTDMDSSNISCSATLNGTVYRSNVFDLRVTQVPDPIVSVFVRNIRGVDLTAIIAQTVGQPLTLWCVAITVRGITSRVDIVWREGDRVLNRTNGTNAATFGISLMYTSSYNISQLNTTDDGRVIECEVVINASPSVMASGNITLDVTVPNFMVRIEPRSDELTVGDEAIIDCTVSTVSGVELSSVMISWIGPRGVITNDSRVTITPTTSSDNSFNNSVIFEYLEEINIGTYTCNVMILDTSRSQSVELSSLNVTIPTPAVSVTALNNQTVGQPLTLQCNVTTVRGITSRVDIVWSNGSTVLQRMNNVSSTMMSNSLVYTNSYNISILSITNDGDVIQCEVEINTSPPILANGDITLDVMVPSPNVTISPPGPTLGAMVGSPQDINCTVSTVSGVESSLVIISWMGPGVSITNESRVTISPTTFDGSNYISSLSFEYLAEEDEGIYMCNVTILDTRESESIAMSLTIPDPIVSVFVSNTHTVDLTALSAQTVGQPLTLWCVVTPVRGITSRVDIVWREGDRVLNRTNATTLGILLVYIDSYNISQLNTTDDGRVIQCEVVINANPSVMASGNITLDVTVPNFMVRIEPRSDELTVGDEAIIDCTVSTVSGVELSSVTIIWIGPRGVITNDSRVIISPTTSSGNNYTSSLWFTYLMEGDKGTYTCNVMILDTSESQSVDLSSLNVVVPPPTVSVTATRNQTVGQSLTLQCEVTTVRGITSRVDIVWSIDNRVLNTTDGIAPSGSEDSLLYTDGYTISPLSTDDENRTYQCEVMINSNVLVNDKSSVTLDVTVPQATINIAQSREGTVSGLNHTLTCTVVVASGVSESLVVVNWDREDSESSISFGNMTTDDGLQFTRAIQFLPLLEDDGTEYTCSVSVNGFDEASSSDSVTIMVNAPNLNVAVFPPKINDADIAINLTCTATVEEDVMLDQYVFYWMLNDAPIYQFGERINITTEESSLQSILFISSNDTLPTDSGIYTCEVNLTINGIDRFTASNSSTVRIIAISPPLAPDVTNVTTAVYSVNISWIVRIIVNDVESYTVFYGTDVTSLTNSSEVIIGNTGLSTINEMFTVNIDGLIPFTTYYFIVSANNSVNTTSTAVMNFTTDETAPGIAPQSFTYIVVTATSITFQWDNLTRRQANGIVRNFTIKCTAGNSSVTIVDGTSTTGTVGSLNPFTEYICNIFAFTVLPGPTSNPPIEVTTAQSASNPPVINTIVDINSSTVRVTWTRPTMPNGIITTYTVTYNNSMSMTVPYNGENTQFYDITGLSPHQLVTVTITATNGGGTSDLSEEAFGRSSEAIPGVVELQTDQNTIIWSPPLQPNGIITGYQVIYSIYQNDSNRASGRLSSSTTRYTIGGLNPGVPYEVVVVAFTSVGRGEVNIPEVFFSEELSPSKAPENVTSERLNSTSVNISWIPLTLFEAQGFPEYAVTLTEMMDSNTRRKRQIDPITTSDSFAIFTGLNENAAYTAMVGVRTGVQTDNPSTVMFTGPVTVPRANTPEDDSDIPIGAIVGGIIGGILAIIILIVIIIIIYCVYTSRHQSDDMNKSTPVFKKSNFKSTSFSRGSFSKKNELPLIENQDFSGNGHATFEMNTITDKNNNVKAAISSKPILIKDFAAHVAELHKNTDHGFEVEYGSVSSDPIGPSENAKSPENNIKNRYANIFGYDDSCVKLQCDSENESGYINASYIDGYAKPNAYIATQGPMPGTVGDFWQMIWEQKVKTVVMLTKLMEGNKPKCEQYWPNKVGESINPKPSLAVTFVRVQIFADYEIRLLRVKSTSDPNGVPLEINHYFFTSWPDHGVPRYTTALISFIKRVRQSHSKSSSSPLVVHCSAGVGRTGTFIALDTMLERIPQTHDVNVYECVLNMRKRRTYMVQTKAQYIFIHDALDELITCGETAFSVQSLRVKVSRMSRAIPGTNKTGFQEQFELLQKVSRAVTSDDCSDALAEYNKEKNFSIKAIPFNVTRVHLSSTNTLGSDYINASFIDGYKCRNAYIATQCPLVSTVDSFWRMLYEFKSGVVVTLCSPQHDKGNFLQYWPEKETDYGNIKVTLTSSGNSSGYDFYKFTVSIKEQAPHQVTMLHYTGWPAENVAKDAKVLLSLIKEMFEIQRTTKNKAITVMCSDGCARTGTFIAISHTLDRIKVEGALDIFQVLKSSRNHRPGLVANVEQYKFCHEVVGEFLDDFDQYSNFK